jgi:hypothetical protein
MDLDRIGQRFRAAASALKDLNDWLEHGGSNPPPCVVERMEIHSMTSEQYYQMWKSFEFLDPRQRAECVAIEDSAIHKVQPDWRRRPDP